jgi:hypothetical protein
MVFGAKRKAVRTLWGRWDSLLVLVGWELFVSTYQFSEVGGVIAPWVVVFNPCGFLGLRGVTQIRGLTRILQTHNSSRCGAPGGTLRFPPVTRCVSGMGQLRVGGRGWRALVEGWGLWGEEGDEVVAGHGQADLSD